MKTPIIALLASLLAFPAFAGETCRLIVEAATGKVIYSEGAVEKRHAPYSSFKFPLAVMGFDAKILISPKEPLWEYDPAKHRALRPDEQQAINPLDWERISVLWFSQELTTRLGEKAFAHYIRAFHYGNGDISGDPGKNNGLTESWLSSSLLISAKEQVAFLNRFFRRELGVSEAAYEQTQAIIPRFEAGDGWIVQGKTGSSKDRKFGWFIGWAEKGGRRLLFAEVIDDETAHTEYGGFRARDRFLKALPASVRGEKKD